MGEKMIKVRKAAGSVYIVLEMTIPIAIRKRYGIESGDYLDITPQKDGFYVEKVKR